MKPYTIEQAEADLRAAIDADDLAEMNRLGAIVDSLDVKRPPVSLHSAALYYAEQGLRVFPLSPGTKIPIKGSGGCLDATSDPEQVNAWWTANPAANIGIATGHLIDVVDIDGLKGQTSRAKNWDRFGVIDEDCIAKVITPRPGGMHIWVPATGDGNATNIVPGVDYRGAGGYVVAPPSINEIGRYTFLGSVDTDRLAALAAA